MSFDAYSTWVEIDLGAIQHNVKQIRSITRKPLMAIVKGNGYGHGIVQSAEAAMAGGAEWLGVARVEEGLALREGGVEGRILVLGFTPPPRIAEAIQGNMSVALFDMDLAAEYARRARAAHGALKVHLKLDTGMGRLGVFPDEAIAFVRQARALKGLEIEGLFTHFSTADAPEEAVTNEQILRFEGALTALEAAGLRPPVVHAANSAGSVYFPQARYDLTRAGIAIYGLQPSGEAPLPANFRPALAWKARIVSIKDLPAGHSIGYNHRYQTTTPERVGVISVGYADGFRRRLGNFVLAGGKRAPVLGGVCMDQCVISLQEMPDVRVGDEAVLVGRQGEAVITAEEVGAAWGSINYDVVCGLAARVQRVYLNAPRRASAAKKEIA